MEIIKSTMSRDTEHARELHQSGVKQLKKGYLEKAEAAFEQAVIADNDFGPAHNNLGLLQFGKRDLHSAAWSFQRAIELMPKRPEPYNNLGLTLEAAGKIDEAVGMYQSAHQIAPGNPEYLGNLARARLTRGDPVASVRDDLCQLLFIERRPEWVHWAQEQLALFMKVDSGNDLFNSEGTDPAAGPEVLPAPLPEAIPFEGGFMPAPNTTTRDNLFPDELLHNAKPPLEDVPVPLDWPSATDQSGPR